MDLFAKDRYARIFNEWLINDTCLVMEIYREFFSFINFYFLLFDVLGYIIWQFSIVIVLSSLICNIYKWQIEIMENIMENNRNIQNQNFLKNLETFYNDQIL